MSHLTDLRLGHFAFLNSIKIQLINSSTDCLYSAIIYAMIITLIFLFYIILFLFNYPRSFPVRIMIFHSIPTFVLSSCTSVPLIGDMGPLPTDP